MNKHFKILLAVIVAGCLLRVLLLNAPFTEDERKDVIIARSISFDPNNLNLPIEDPYETHPLLNVYATKLGLMLFGESNFGIRFFHLLFGSLTLLLIYLLAKEMGRREALWAVFLLAFNQFHMHVSIKAENNSLLFVLTTLSIWIFFKAVQNNDRKLFLWLGPLCGLAFLTKGVSLLLAPAFFLYLLSDAQKRAWFRTRELYFALLFFFITISPWIIWVMVHGSSQLIFQPEMYQKSHWIPNRTALNFFLIGPMSWIEGVDYRLRVSWEDAIVDGLSGIVLLVGTFFSIRFFKQDFYRLLSLIFIVFFSVLSFFNLPGLKWGEFWWAALCLIPAVCLTAKMFVEINSRYPFTQYFVGLYGFYLALNAILFVMTADRLGYPPRRFAAFVDDDYITARIYEDKKMFGQAIAEVKRLLENSPNDIETLSYLGWLYIQQNDFNAALDAWFKAMEIEPDFIHDYNLFYSMNYEITPRYARGQETINQKETHFYRGVINYYNKLYDAALEDLEICVNAENYRLEAHYYLGLIYLQKKMINEATEHFKQVLRIDPKYARGYFQLGQCYSEAGQDQLAVENYIKALKINPDDARGYYHLGLTYQKLGQSDKAQNMFHQAKNIYHDDLKTRFALGNPYE